jgi:hypothetical protein
MNVTIQRGVLSFLPESDNVPPNCLRAFRGCTDCDGCRLGGPEPGPCREVELPPKPRLLLLGEALFGHLDHPVHVLDPHTGDAESAFLNGRSGLNGLAAELGGSVRFDMRAAGCEPKTRRELELGLGLLRGVFLAHGEDDGAEDEGFARESRRARPRHPVLLGVARHRWRWADGRGGHGGAAQI